MNGKVKDLWSKHFDSEYKTHYWHNSQTGQSLWNVDDIPTDNEATKNEYENFYEQQQQHQKENIASTPSRELDLEYDHTEAIEFENKAQTVNVKSHRKRIESFHISSPSTVANESDNDNASLLRKEKTKTSKGAKQSQVPFVYASTSREIWMYSVFIFINALLIEGPLAFIECIVRAFFFLFASSLVLIAMLCFPGLSSLTFRLIREAFLCGAAAITLCFPGAPCLVYRRYSADNEWELAPLPTVLGWVDARRFISFSFSNGSFASNVLYRTQVETNSTKSDINNDDPFRLKSYPEDKQPEPGQRQWPCQDYWEGSILLEPRRVQADIIRIVRGEDPLGILL